RTPPRQGLAQRRRGQLGRPADTAEQQDVGGLHGGLRHGGFLIFGVAMRVSAGPAFAVGYLAFPARHSSVVTSLACPNRSAAMKAAWTWAAGTTAPSNSWSRVAQASCTTTHR